MLRDWLPFLIYGLMALAIPASMIGMSFAFAQRPKARTKARTIPFESGVSQGQMKPQRYTVSFYLTAMLFIVFDIEIVFLYPFAVIFKQLHTFGLVEVLVFAVVVLVSFLYLVSNGALSWGPAKRLRVGLPVRTSESTIARVTAAPSSPGKAA